MMDADEEYLKQFEEIFNSYCLDNESTIDESQLLKLCQALSLNKDCISHIRHLSFSHQSSPSRDKKLNFSEFCDCFVAALTKFNEVLLSDGSSSSNEEIIATAAEVKPLLIRGGKAYGRKSKPLCCTKETSQMENGSDFDYKEQNGFVNCDEVEKEEDSFYYEPSFDEHKSKKENYFEAIGMAETTPQKTAKNKILQKNISSSTLFDSIVGISSASLLDFDDIDFFSCFCNEGVSTIKSEHLLEFWKQGGVDDPQTVLQALDLLHLTESGFLDSGQLSTALQREVLVNLKSQPSSLNYAMTLALLHSYNLYLRQTNSKLVRYRHQVDKMKEEFDRKERRHSKILEEVDDRCLGLDQQHEKKLENTERKWNRKLLAAQRSFDQERESLLLQANSERGELLKEIENLRSSENLLRRKVKVLACENKTLSEDAVMMLERLTEADKDAGRLRKDLECLLAAKQSDELDPVNTSQEEKFAMIIKDYEAQCRHLSDRNDELASENRELRSQLRLQEIHINQEDFYREKKMSCLKRKKSSRKRRSDVSIEESSDASFDDDISGIKYFDRRCTGSSPEQSMALNFASVRMRELEELVEDLRSEKRRALDNFALEKAQLKADLQEEFRSKIDANSVHCYDDNRAVEEHWITTKNHLEDTIQERDELEAKYKELKESMERETSSGEREIADLCRQFADEKKEITEEHNKQMTSLDDKLNSAKQKLEEEKQTNERLTNQLKFERTEHKEALAAHQEIIANLEKNAVSRDNDLANEKLAEAKRLHLEELEQLKRDHVAELELVKHDTEQRLQTLLSDKQIPDNSSMCSELERLQESIEAERAEMHERMHVMREAFESEAEELRHLVNHDKTELVKLLNEEVCLMKQKIAEEGEMELQRRKQTLEEEWKRERESINAKQEESKDIIYLRSEVDLLQERNFNLERLLAQSRVSLEEEETKLKKSMESRISEEILQQKLEDLKRDFLNKEIDNKNLRMQVNELLKQEADINLMMSSLRTQCYDKESQRHHLQVENESLVAKINSLEEECRSLRIDNAGRHVNCERLGKNASVPTPMKRHHAQEKKREEMEERMEEMKKEVDDLRSKFAPNGDSFTSVVDDVMAEAESSLSPSSGGSSTGKMRTRLFQSRQELTEQLGRMKDLYRKLSKSERLVKDLYCENAQLMRALQITETRQREAETCRDEEREKNLVLNRLIRGLCEQIM